MTAPESYFEHEGQRVYYCNPKCARDGALEPERFIAAAYPASRPVGNTACPACNEAVGDTTVTWQGRRVGLCSAQCKAVFRLDPAQERPSSPGPAVNIAQANRARMRFDVDDERMRGFFDQLDAINALADAAPGFVWRLQTEAGNSTDIRAYEDARILFNASVWQSLEALEDYVYKSAHLGVYQARGDWFERPTSPAHVLWWVPVGHVPTVEEAVARFERLEREGPSPAAFTFGTRFPAPA